MKKVILIIIFVFLFFPLNIFAQDDYEFVVDQVPILSSDTTNYINKHSNEIYNKEKIEYYVVAVNSTDGNKIDKYAKTLYKEFELSEKGIIIVLSYDERSIGVYVGSELSSIIPSNVIDEYINDYFLIYLKDNEWDKGIKNGYSSFYKLLSNYYDFESNEVVVYSNSFVSKYYVPIIGLIIWIITIIGYVFSECFIRLMNKKRKFIDIITLIISLIVSILLLVLTYMILPKVLILVLGFEMVAIFSNLYSNSRSNNKKKKRKGRKNKRRLKSNKKR